jgi:two-component system cell cycle sensor histidine kinase/response regulator CckA
VAVAALVAFLIVLLIISLTANNLSADFERGKKAEEALLQSEVELRALFASMHDLVLVIDRAGVYRKIAPTNPELLVKPPEQLLGITLRDVFPPDQAETFLKVIQQVLTTKQTAPIEYDLIIGDRTVRFETAISPMTEDSTLWVAHDITRRKRTEEKLAFLNQQNELILNSAGEGILGLNSHGNHSFVNRASLLPPG